MNVMETERLALRRLVPEDAPFILELVNDPAWLRFIGDKGVHTLDDAEAYIRNGPMAMYARHGFGLLLVSVREDDAPIGMCGLIKRDSLEDVDVGFALLPRYRGRGYAGEAVSAVLAHGRQAFGMRRVVAITSPDNWDSIRVLEKAGMQFERLLEASGEPLKLFGMTL